MIASREYVKDLISKVLSIYGDKLLCKKEIIGLNKQVSSVGAYITSPIDVNPFQYEYVYIKLYYTGYSTTITLRNVPGQTSSSFTMGEFTINLSTTSVGCSRYSSAWKDVRVDLVGYSTPAYMRMNEEINNGSCWD